VIRPAPITAYLRPADVAQRLDVDVHAVLAWIKRGELRAINTAAKVDGKRPRWRISPTDLTIFEGRRAAGPAPQVTHRRRRTDANVISFF